MSAPQKKILSMKDFKDSGAFKNDDDEPETEAKGRKAEPMDEFMSYQKDGPVHLENDVSVDSDMDSDIREIITSNRKLNSDELFARNEQLYKWLVKRAGKVLRRKGRGYDRLTELHEKKKAQDPAYVRINAVLGTGRQGRLAQVSEATADTSWRASVRLHGPAFRRKRAKYLIYRPPKTTHEVSAQEAQRVVSERENIAVFNRFLKNEKLLSRGLPAEHPETRAARLAREDEEWEEEKVYLKEQGDFKRIREPLDALQQRASLLDWDYGIYRIWDVLRQPLPGE
jgi:hypothetical protein